MVIIWIINNKEDRRFLDRLASNQLQTVSRLNHKFC